MLLNGCTHGGMLLAMLFWGAGLRRLHSPPLRGSGTTTQPSVRALPLSVPHSEFSQLHRLLPFGVGVEKTAPLKANLLPTALHGAASRAAPAALRGATSSEKADRKSVV